MDLAYCATQPLTQGTPNVPLNPSFAHGWNKLPTELKVQIIAYNSLDVTDEPDAHITFGTRHLLVKHIALYAYCNPEFGTLMQEAVYKNNTFAIATTAFKCRLPPPKYRPRIRRLALKIDMYLFVDRSVSLFDRLQDGTLGFTQLLHLRVNFHQSSGRGLFKGRRALLQRKLILMAKEGKVSIEVEPPFTGAHHTHFLAGSWRMASGIIKFGVD